MKLEDFDFDVIDLDKTDTIPKAKIEEAVSIDAKQQAPIQTMEKNPEDEFVFEGEITYTDSEMEINASNDLGDTMIFEPIHSRSVYAEANSVQSNSPEAETVKEDGPQIANFVNEHAVPNVGTIENRQTYASLHGAEEDDESFKEEDSLFTTDEMEELEDLTYHDEEEEYVPKRQIRSQQPQSHQSHSQQTRLRQHPTPVRDGRPVRRVVKKKRPNGNKAPYELEKRNSNSSGKTGFQKFLSKLSWMDAVIGITGVLVIGIVIFLISFFVGNNRAATEVGEFVSIGSNLSSLGSIGESGIVGISEVAANDVAGEGTSENGQSMSVSVSFTSVEKDLKIKFADKNTGALVTGVEFEVELVTPDKKTLNWKDEDKDGVIYQDSLKAGSYSVTIKTVDGFRFPEEATVVTVKDKITYQAINVMDEIKDEKDIDVSKEDTETKKDVDTEPLLADTVTWVASTATILAGADGYAQVDKSTIKDPVTLTAGRIGSVYWKAAAITGAAVNVKVNGSEAATANVTEEAGFNYQYLWASADSGKATVSGAGKTATVTGVAEGSTSVTCTVTKTSSSDASAVTTDTYSFAVTVSPSSSEGTSETTSEKTSETTSETTSEDSSEPSSQSAFVTGITLDQSTLAVKMGTTASLKATVAGDTGCNTNVTWASDKATIATVDANGKVTPVAIGTAVVTATTVGKDKSGNVKSASCTVTVTPAGALKLTLDKTTATVLVGETITIVPKVENHSAKNTVTYVSSLANVGTVSSSGVVTGVTVGTTVITVTTDEKDPSTGKAVTATCTVTVKANPKKDTTTLLKDTSGRQIYVKGTDGKYREAKWADYYTAGAFYIASDIQYKYTGWQTLNGHTYFFDANGKAVTGEQVISGVKYNFANDGTLSMNGGVLGIDVSKWNGTIDWNAVKNSGISFVIIRCGYRGSSTGVLVQDPKFASYAQGATAAGLKVGLYFFTQAVNEVEAVQEASMAVTLARNYKISYPIFIDTEYTSGGRANNLSVDERTAICKAFCETVKGAGYTPGIYASKTWYTGKLNMSTLNAYKVWLAQYASAPTYTGRYDMWQHSSKGRINGIKGDVDLNISYLGY